jgi:hypothetical protein
MNNRMNTCAKWTADENEMFIKVINMYGLNWSELKAHLPHRSLTQLKTHANNLKRRYKDNKQYFVIKKYPRKRVALQHERIEAEKTSLLFTKLFPNKRNNKSRLTELKELHEVIRIIDNVRNYKTETANTNEDNICNNNCNCNCNDCSCTVLSSLLLMSYIYYIYDYLSVYMYLEMYLHRRNKALALSLCSFIITYSALSKLCNDMFSFV